MGNAVLSEQEIHNEIKTTDIKAADGVMMWDIL